ncbi:hypothetical protein RB195_000106 [Necator americanus]|uniref:Kunitz/Bovine pancreatic trypsin inhibitor domain protein n=1 Tax=Necator americanus TaxID=51031 RepID=A0ABR1D7Z3_NECAM
MQEIVAAVATLCFLVPLCASFPMCTDGQPPLMEANDAFPCARGCPLGFLCEMQDSLSTAAIGICCANRTELRLLYGSNNKDHIDPIWNENNAMIASRKSGAISSLSSTETPKPGTIAESARTDVTVPRNGSSSVLSTEILSGMNQKDHAIEAPEVHDSDILSVVVPKNETTTEDIPQKFPSIGSEEQRTAADAVDSVSMEHEKTITNGTVTNPENNIEQSKGLEMDTVVSPPINKDELVKIAGNELLSVLTVNTTENDTIIGDSTNNNSILFSSSEESLMDVNSTEYLLDMGNSMDVLANISATTDEEISLKFQNTTSIEGMVPNEGFKVENSTKEEGLSDGPILHVNMKTLETNHAKGFESPSTVSDEILDKQNVIEEFQLNKNDTLRVEEEKEKQTTYSCERQPYEFSCHSGSVLTQPTIRWYLNNNGECEYYPWGYCPGDRVMESTTIRTKKECERECLKKSTENDEADEIAEQQTKETDTDATVESIKIDGGEQLLKPLDGQEGRDRVDVSANDVSSALDLESSMEKEKKKSEDDNVKQIELEQSHSKSKDNDNAAVSDENERNSTETMVLKEVPERDSQTPIAEGAGDESTQEKPNEQNSGKTPEDEKNELSIQKNATAISSGSVFLIKRNRFNVNTPGNSQGNMKSLKKKSKK